MLNQSAGGRTVASLYARYLRERTQDEIIETDKGFATYRYLNEQKTVYIVDIYVLPDLRKSGIASELANFIVEIAKVKGAKELIGTVTPSAKNSADSIRVLLGYGMTLLSASNDMIVFRKDI